MLAFFKHGKIIIIIVGGRKSKKTEVRRNKGIIKNSRSAGCLAGSCCGSTIKYCAEQTQFKY